jgi:hypothetical protein
MRTNENSENTDRAHENTVNLYFSPSSKSHIRELYQRIAHLEATLEAATASRNFTDSSPNDATTQGSPAAISTSPLAIPLQDGDNIISRLCGRQWKLNSDEEGQYKFFGPTSSLHLTESVSSSLLGPWCQGNVTESDRIDDMIDSDIKDHLLEFYWKYQHTVLQVFDREEFLEGMRTGQTKYFSKALLYTIYVCAARISDRPAVRAMVIPSHEDGDEEQLFLVATATRYVEQELKRPQITTIQALLLLSIIHCSLGRDTKGWLLTGMIYDTYLRFVIDISNSGDACRLAIDLGLHRIGGQLASTNLSPRDKKVRQITYLGCLVFDR